MTGRHWQRVFCPDGCGALVYVVRAGTFGRDRYLVDAEPHESGYVHLTEDVFGNLDQPVGAFCSDSEILRRLAADPDAEFHRLHLFCETAREVA